MMMLVNIGRPEKNSRFLSNAFFLAIVIGPWLVMIWLLWPR